MGIRHKLANTFLPSVLGLFSLLPLSAEKNGAFMEAGFQYSYAWGSFKQSIALQETIMIPGVPYVFRATTQTANSYDGNLYGGDIQIGYKLFIGETRRFGLRFYGFFSGQKGYANSVHNSDSDPIFVVKDLNAINLFYGGGMDMLFNFYDDGEHSFGVFGGAMVGGSSWFMGKDKYCNWANAYNYGRTGCVTMNQYFKDQVRINGEHYPGLKTFFAPNFLQVIVNLGFRFNLTKHQGLEVGVRIPIINDPYYLNKGTYSSKMGILKRNINVNSVVKFRRNIVAFANYVINF
ncbi:outer membrane protein [Helicobacter bizzozeronii]|uniref:outer membrane protein n=1 Tax=Helicobacter bizzozeronii TaxID=56877 RepID=UPI000CEE1365|nr:outer membrane protein [Helicobacter bizzozeronii]